MNKKLNKLLGLIVFLTFLVSSLLAQQNLQVYYRKTISLNGNWNHIVDPYEHGYYNYRYEPHDQTEGPWTEGYYVDRKTESPADRIEYDFDKSALIQVPGDWNTQDPKYYYYEGTIWYRKKFDSPKRKPGERVFLYFGAVNYEAIVYLNAKRLGSHTGGFTPFYFEITDLINSDDNSLVVKVDNKRHRNDVPTLMTDWWNYGGITRDVKLVVVPETFVKDYQIRLNSIDPKIIEGKIYLDGTLPESVIQINIPELKIAEKIMADQTGNAEFSFQPKSIELWSPENPKLYRIEIVTSQDQLVDSVSFRSIAVRGNQLLLNDKPIFLQGICIHEEYAADGGGRVNAAWKAEELLGWTIELGCNFVRLAHYPHSEDMVRIAERKGILVWSEVPVYWTINWESEAVFMNARKQLEENILRDRNRSNIIIWSLANETPVSEKRNVFLRKLAKHARELDDSRLLSLAMEKHYITEDTAVVQDPLADIVDILSFNQYVGWYDGLPEKCERVSWKIPYNKPVFISEFGGGAKYGYHGKKNERWTEDFQEDLYIKSLGMLDKIEGLCGISPWILVDFRSPRRPLPEIQDDFNRKGVISEKGEKKKAFYVLKEYYKTKK